MIELVEKFSSIEKPLTDLIVGHKSDYMSSPTYKKLCSRIDTLKNSNDMNFGGRFSSKLGFPIQKSVSMMRKFVMDQSYRPEQLFQVKSNDSVDTVTARNIEDVLNDNLRRTRFKERAFNRIKLSCSDYGAAVCYSAPGILRQPHYKTQAVRDEAGNVVNIERVFVDTPDIVVANKWMDPRNYIQDPDCPFPEESSYRGHVERWDVYEFINYVQQNKDFLVKKNVNRIIEKIKKAGYTDQFYTYDENGGLKKFPVDITIMYSTCNIKGNEDNASYYYIEMVDDMIIRIESHLYAENLRPYSVFNLMPRQEVWWGNTDGELVLPHEQATNTLIGLKMSNAIRAEDQIFLTPKGVIDSADWNNRRYSGGMVEVDLPEGQRMSDMFYQWQTTDYGISTFDSMIREINSSRQGVGSKPDVGQRVSRTSPLQNTTATGVNAMQEQGDIKEGSYQEQFNYGVIEMGRNNITLLQQFLPDDFVVVSSPGKTERFLNKTEILGEADITIRTSLTNNKAFEAQRYLNAINTVMNWRGTQDPALTRIALEPLVKTALHRLDLGDINELYPELPPQITTQEQLPQQGAPIA